MATSKYNPYNAVKSISDLKGKWHTARDMGQDYSPYATEATQYYDELRANGYGDVADELTANDYIGSLDILARYKPDTDFEIDTVYNDLMDSMGGNTFVQEANTAKPDTDFDIGSFYDDLLGKTSGDFSSHKSSTTADDILAQLYNDDWQKQYADMMGTASDIATGKIQAGTSDAVQQILDSFTKTNDFLNGEIKYDANGKVIGGMNADHYNTGKDQLDYINNFDYTKQSYFDPIMQSYQLKGGEAAKNALAETSGGGNLDSYAAANANRQQLSFTTAGHEAARAAAQQNQDNWQALYNAMSGDLSDIGAINAQNLQTGAGMYATDSAERQNALNNAVGMADSEAARRMNAYLGKLSDDTTRYGIDADVAMNRENNAANLANEEAARKLEQYIAELTDNTNRYNIDAGVQTNRENNAAAMAQASLSEQLERYLADLNDSTTRYGIDAETKMNDANNSAAMAQLLKQLEAETSMNNANNAAEMARLEKEIESQNYASTIEELLAKLGIKNSYGDPLVDEEAAYKAANTGTNDRSRSEMQSYLANAIAGMQSGEYEDLNTFDDVKAAVMEIFPQYESEIDDYIKQYTLNALTPTHRLK